jgi:hypothetical protein
MAAKARARQAHGGGSLGTFVRVELAVPTVTRRRPVCHPSPRDAREGARWRPWRGPHGSCAENSIGIAHATRGGLPHTDTPPVDFLISIKRTPHCNSRTISKSKIVTTTKGLRRRMLSIRASATADTRPRRTAGRPDLRVRPTATRPHQGPQSKTRAALTARYIHHREITSPSRPMHYALQYHTRGSTKEAYCRDGWGETAP